MNSWFPYNNGRSIGIRSAEGGRIVRDEEHLLGARMTIKQGYKYVTVSCRIAGKIDHTRFFNGITAAKREYLIMQKELNKVIMVVSSSKMTDIKAWEAISDFVSRFP